MRAAANGDRLREEVSEGVAGSGLEAGADWSTQQQQLQATHLVVSLEKSSLVAKTWANASNTLNKMPCTLLTNSSYSRICTITQLLFSFDFGFFELFDVLGRIFVEIFKAILATEFDFAAFVFIDVRLAHFTEFLPGNDASS